MAKTASSASQRGKKKVRKNVTDAVAHIHASFNNTIITITDRQGNTLSWATSGGAGFRAIPFRGQLRAAPALRAREKARPLPPRWPPKLPARWPLSAVLKTSKFVLRALARGANPLCGRLTHWAFV